ncbi:LuxR family transcriptional regulator [Sphingobium sufflavum]|uniref:helix-turn-helix transcriptional regulator n=1 Tax=Sphingobium sufflavum TaxID=1129547 RepID=UPI001F482D4E|nr:LuxR family transcriptional regulator [Sphingobium sufflavum]MCE7798659.1 LuxR family transcriptional regulator [Sphingobium sufflavum]
MENVVEQIARCETLPLLWRLMIGYFRDRGYGAVCYFTCAPGEPGQSPGPVAPPVHHGFSAAVIEAYLGSNYEQIDIVPRMTLAHGRPLRWSEVWAGVETTDEERRFLTLLREVQMGDGYTLPCYGPNGRNGYVAIGGMGAQSVTDEASLREMHLSAQAAHLRICEFTLTEPQRGKPLSAREREILDWVARGKSNSVIADILCISAGTVDTYLRRIYEKLGVSDRTSAAVRGIGMGLIAA